MTSARPSVCVKVKLVPEAGTVAGSPLLQCEAFGQASTCAEAPLPVGMVKVLVSWVLRKMSLPLPASAIQCTVVPVA